MRKAWTSAVLAALLGLSLVACSDEGSGATSGSSDTSGSGKYRIAYIVKAMSDQFWINMKAGAQAAASANDVRLSFQSPEKETDVEKQIQMVENAVTDKVDAIILSAADSKALIPSIVKANKANIPVILVNDTIDENELAAAGGKVETYVGIDQYQAASLAGKYAATKLQGGKVVLLEGIAGVKALEDRLNGFKDQVAHAPGFDVVASQTANNDRNQAFNVMQNILTSKSDVSVVWAINAESGQGAIEAIQQANVKHRIDVFDFDASDDDVAAIKAGTLTGSVAQFPAIQAQAAIRAALDVIAGKKLEAKTVTKAELITKDNVAAFEAGDLAK